MKLTIKTQDLKNALPPYKKVTTKNLISALSGVMLVAGEDQLTIYGTNLEQSIKTVIPAKVESPGNVVIPFVNMEKIASVCKDEDINIELFTKTEKVTVSEYPEIEKADEHGNFYKETDYSKKIEVEKDKVVEEKLHIYKLKLNTLSKEDFPNYPDTGTNPVDFTRLNFKEFLTTIDRMKEYASKDKSRIILSSLYCDLPNSCIVATDSYRLAKKDFNFNTMNYYNKTAPEDRILPMLSFAMPIELVPMLKTIKNPESEFTLVLNTDTKKDKSDNVITFTKQIVFQIGNVEIVSRTISGRYPDMKALIPDDFTYQVKLDAKKLGQSLDEADKLISSDDIPVRLYFDDKLDISLESKETGKYEDTLAIENLVNNNVVYQVVDCDGEIRTTEYKLSQAHAWIKDHEGYYKNLDGSLMTYDIKEAPADNLEIYFNPYFLKSCIKDMDNPVMYAIEPLKPVVIKEDDDFITLLMPIRHR